MNEMNEMNEMKESKHSVKYNFFMNFILTASSFLFPLITFPYVSRVLGTAGNGKISLASSVANYFLMVASLGIPTYGVRACAKVRDDKDELSKTAQEILIINLICTFFVTVTYLICIALVPRFREDKGLYLIEGISIVLNAFGANWVFQALEQYDYITARSILFKFLSMVLMFIFVHQKDDYLVYALITVLASVGSNVLNFIRLRHYISFRHYSHYQFRRHLKPIFILFAQNATVSVYTNLDTVMLGFIKGDVDVGLYNAAVKVKAILVSVVTSLGNVLLPRMSYYVRYGAKDEFYELMSKALNATLLMALPLTAYFVLMSKDSILFLAGSEYLGAVTAMQIITFAVIPNGLTGVLGVQVLTPLGKEKYVLYSVTFGAVSDFILNCFMIPRWDASGAALATTIAEFIVLAVQLYYCREYLPYMKKQIHLFRYFIFSVLAMLSAVLLLKLQIASAFLRLLITVAAFGAVYGALLFASKDEFLTPALQNRFLHKNRAK